MDLSCPHSAARLVAAIGAVALVTAACGSSAKNLTGSVSAPTPPAAVSPAASTAALACHAQATRPHPRDHSTVGIRVTTVPHAKVTAVDARSVINGQSASGHANAQGQRTLRFRVGSATPGLQVMIDVRISSHGRKGSCQASFEPRAALAAAVQPPPAPTSPPRPAPPPTTAAPPPPPPPSPATCHPLSDEGTCYEPGEFCRDSDHGVTGLAGDGETIRCEDNDGWRWEPV
jgi:hypothetical protein